MSGQILKKIRRLNWVLQESTTGTLSYKDLSVILCELINANVYIIDEGGNVLGVAYTNIEDSSTFEDEFGYKKISHHDNDRFLSINESRVNLYGPQVRDLLGNSYTMADKYHTLVPVVCGGRRLGTLLLTRYEVLFDDEEVALCEYGATVVGLEIQRNLALAQAKEAQLTMAVQMAMGSMSYSEKDALSKIFQEIHGDEGLIVASKIAGQYGLTNSIIVNALRKLESAGLLESKSMGMKGTRIKILNPYLKEAIEELK